MMATDYRRPPMGLSWRSKKSFILATIAIGMFIDLFLYGLIVPILPFILAERISIPHSEIQYYTSLLLACYAAASVVFSLPAGIIADKTQSRQLPYLIGIVALTLSTILLWLGQSIPMLIIARLLQGISAAVVWTVGMALVMDTVGPKKLGVTIGSIFGIISVGELLAPVIGGVAYKAAGSGAVFGIGVGLLVVDFAMRLLIIEKKVAARYGLIEPSTPQDDRVEEACESETSPLLRPKNQEKWKIPRDQPKLILKFPILYCLRNPRLLTAQVTQIAQALLLGLFDATIPIEAQDLFGFDSLKAGLLFIPLVVPYLVLSPITGKIVDRHGTKPNAVIGFAYLAIPLLLSRTLQAGGTPEIIKFCVFAALAGLGMALIGSPSIVEASYVVEEYYNANKDFFGENGPFAQLYAINSASFSFGLSLGPALAGLLRTRIGFGNTNAVVAGICLCVSFLSFFYMGEMPKMFRKRHSRL